MAKISLERFGWAGCWADVSNMEHLPTWRHLNILRAPEKYGTRILRFPYDMLKDASGVEFMPAIQFGNKIAEGTYGAVYQAQRATYRREAYSEAQRQLQRIGDFQDIVSKTNTIEITPAERRAPHNERERIWRDEIHAVLFEATLHAMVYSTLKRHGHGHAAPVLYDVFGTADVKHPTSPLQISQVHIQMELVEGTTLHDYLRTHFPTATDAKQLAANDALLLDVLIQLAFYMDILQTDLHFNHRDLKVNNVLRRGPAKRQALQHAALVEPWTCTHDLVIIDFGFSCIACSDEDVKSRIQAGSWFRADHDCLKRGRDMALFIFCLNAFYPLKERITGGLWDILCAVMVPNTNTNTNTGSLLHTGINGNMQFDAEIYRFLRADGRDVPDCAPRALMKKLSAFKFL